MSAMPESQFQASLKDIRSLLSIAIALQCVAFLSIAPLWLFACLFMFVLFLYVPQLASAKLLRNLLTLVCVALFFIDYRLNYSVEMASVFLLLVGSMKAIELKSKRDVLVFVYAMFYLSAISMLFKQSILHVSLQLASVMICFSLLMRMNDSTLGGVRSQIWRVSKLLALAMPIAICLFLFFPRFAPLWSLPIKTNSSQTGMSEEMTPGSIAELSQSAERAFRVTFSGEVPERSQLYWRAMVLDQFDGRTWSRAQSPLTFERAKKGILFGQKYEQFQPVEIDEPSYDVMLEPHQNRWAFALAGSEPASGNVHQIGAGVYEFVQDVVSPTPYRMSMPAQMPNIDAKAGGYILNGVDRVASNPNQDLKLPRNGNPLARQFVEQLLAQGPTEREYIRALLQFYANNDFGYTLRPPELAADSIDDFLFGTRLGFCEHYASSMTFLLREAGIAARVVAGYQGGEYNDNLDYLVVRQYDAHAWVEAYVPNIGWIRLDPTAFIAPDRIELNLEAAVEGEGTFLADNRLASLARSIPALNWLAKRGDELNYRWQRFVLGYGEREQRALLKRVFGEFKLEYLLWTLLGLLGAVSSVVILYIWLGRYQKKLSRSERKYLRFLLLLRVVGVARQHGETPAAFLRRMKGELNVLSFSALENRTNALHKNLYNVEKPNE